MSLTGLVGMATRVAVVGAGPAGLCALRHLTARPEHFTARAYEQTSSVGGTWVYSEHTEGDDVTSMYSNLRTNLPKEIMGFPGFPFTQKHGASSFIKHQSVLAYLRDYCDHYSLRDHIQFSTRVTGVSPVPGTGDREVWRVTTCNTDSAEERTEEFDAVIVCNGHYSRPLTPALPGRDQFSGTVLHSHTYRHPEPFAGLTVACLGAASSGYDIAIDLAKHAKQVYLCSRHPPFITVLPGNIARVGWPQRLTDTGLVLAEGEELRVDAILYCTGYHYSFPFLSAACSLASDEERLTPLYRHLVHVRHPSLAFIGLPKLICPFPLFDSQVEFFLASLEGRLTLPSQADMLRAEAHDFQRRQDLGAPARYAHRMGQEQWAYNDELRAEAGCGKLPEVLSQLYLKVHNERRSDILHYKDLSYSITGDAAFIQTDTPDTAVQYCTIPITGESCTTGT